MCGLVGIAGNILLKERKIFRDMLLFDVVRGQDSTGVAMVGYKNDDVTVEKDVGTPTDLWEWGQSQIFDYKGYNHKTMGKALLGHNRAATMGKITEGNAHPFTFDHITGAHNGSLYTHSQLEGGREDELDSRCVFRNIAAHGIEDTWGKVDGPAALTWWDSNEGTLNFIRNSHRPLVLAYNKKKDVLFWGSEANFIITAIFRNKGDMFTDEKGEGDNRYEVLPVNTHVKFAVTASGVELKEVQELTPFTKVVGRGGGMNPSAAGYGINHSRSPGKTTHHLGGKPFSAYTKWAKGLDRLDVCTRGMEFWIENYINFSHQDGDTPVFIGRFVEQPSLTLKIFPQTKQEVNELKNACGSKEVWITEARCRLADFAGTPVHYRTSGQHVSQVPNKKIRDVHEEKKQDKNNNIIYPVFNANVDRNSWEEKMKGVGFSCQGCGNPQDITDAPKLYWPADTICICAACQEDSQIMHHFGG